MAKPMAFQKAGAKAATTTTTEPQGGMVGADAPGVGPAAGTSDALMIVCPKCGDHFDAIQALSQDAGASDGDGDEGGY